MQSRVLAECRRLSRVQSHDPAVRKGEPSGGANVTDATAWQLAELDEAKHFRDWRFHAESAPEVLHTPTQLVRRW